MFSSVLYLVQPNRLEAAASLISCCFKSQQYIKASSFLPSKLDHSWRKLEVTSYSSSRCELHSCFDSRACARLCRKKAATDVCSLPPLHAAPTCVYTCCITMNTCTTTTRCLANRLLHKFCCFMPRPAVRLPGQQQQHVGSHSLIMFAHMHACAAKHQPDALKQDGSHLRRCMRRCCSASPGACAACAQHSKPHSGCRCEFSCLSSRGKTASTAEGMRAPRHDTACNGNVWHSMLDAPPFCWQARNNAGSPAGIKAEKCSLHRVHPKGP